jgi:hypothetical protein
VQSTTLYLMACQGVIEPFDSAIFADTQEEPQAVYRHLEWLQENGDFPILVRTAGKLGDHLKAGASLSGNRFASIPAFTRAPGDKREGRLIRQCSYDYKVAVIEKAIRRDLMGMEPYQRVAKGVTVQELIGISLDEIGRAHRMERRTDRPTWMEYQFPLIDLRMTREDCKVWLAEHGGLPHVVPRSACVFCPMHNDAEWLNIKAVPEDWARAVEIDEALRIPGNVVNRKVDKPMYLHRSCVPLAEVPFKQAADPREQLNFGFRDECLGVCGV